MAGKTGMPGHNISSPKDGPVSQISRMAQEIYADYTDKREPYGIDESWLDVTDSATLKGDGFHIAQEISSRMKKSLALR